MPEVEGEYAAAVHAEGGQENAASPDDELTPSQYLAKHVYPVLEPGIVELLKVAFPTDFKDFVRRSSVAASQSQAEEKEEKEAKEREAESQDNEGAEAEAEAEAEPPAAPTPPPVKSALADKSRPTTKSSKRRVSVVVEAPLEKDQLRPVRWLAQYLKERNKKNTAERAEAKKQNALELASKPGEDLETVHANLIAGVKALLWPCSVYIATTDKTTIQVPKPVDPEEEEAKKKADGEEEEAEEAEPAAEEEGGEEGEEKPPKEPEMMDVDVNILRYIASSHPNKDSIQDRTLKYEEEGVSGRALQTRDPVLVRDVSAEVQLLWFPPEPEVRGGSYLAISLTRTPEDQAPYAVLTIDTLLDRRQLTDSDVEMTLRLARAAEAVVHTVPLPPPPPVEEPPVPEQGEGGEEGEEGEEEEEEEEG